MSDISKQDSLGEILIYQAAEGQARIAVRLETQAHAHERLC